MRGSRRELAVCALIALYLAALLGLDHFSSRGEQMGLGLLTWAVLGLALRRFGRERALQVLCVMAFATLAEFSGAILWGVYRYRLGNLPLFVPPAHGLVFLAALSLARGLERRERILVAAAVASAVAWALLGLTVASRTDLAGAAGVPLLLVFMACSRSRGLYASAFFLVALLELYGTSIGTWRWAPTLPGLGIPDGNPPSGVASGYVWFDVMALLTAPALRRLLAARPRLLAPSRRRMLSSSVAS